MIEHTWTEADRLTREEFEAGAPCKNCGRKLLPDRRRPWEFPGMIHMTPEQKRRWDREEAAFKRLHPDCHASRWSIAGSIVNHCSRCCAPHPLSASQIARIAEIFRPHLR